MRLLEGLLQDCAGALKESGHHDLAAELDEYRTATASREDLLRAVGRNLADAVKELERETERALQDLESREAESRLWDASRILHGGELSRQAVERLSRDTDTVQQDGRSEEEPAVDASAATRVYSLDGYGDLPYVDEVPDIQINEDAESTGVQAFDPTDPEAMLDAVLDLAVRVSHLEAIVSSTRSRGFCSVDFTDGDVPVCGGCGLTPPPYTAFEVKGRSIFCPCCGEEWVACDDDQQTRLDRLREQTRLDRLREARERLHKSAEPAKLSDDRSGED